MDMVKEVNVNGGKSEKAVEVPPALVEKPVGLPPGHYTLVGWDMDTTGRRLIDEICQISAYTPKETYCQYIMPYGDLNPGARRRHNLRVVTVGRYRMLKDTTNNKILKTKSEISALSEFIDWLDSVREEGSKVLLIYHEPRRLTPIMLLEALTRYRLLDRFNSIVSGFTDSYALAADKCKSTVKSVSLRVLARVLLDADSLAVNSALDRAKAAYGIVEHLAQGEQQDAAGSKESRALIDTACEWSRPVTTELDALQNLKNILEIQNTFRPVFGPLLRAARPERRHATHLRRLLADAGLRYDELKHAWTDSKVDGLGKQLEALSLTAKQEDVKELIEILDCHFDPEKEAKTSKPFVQRRYMKAPVNSNAMGDGEASSSESQNTTSHNSPSKTASADSNGDAGQDAAINAN